MVEINRLRRDAAFEHAKASREDTLQIAKLEIDSYSAQTNAFVAKFREEAGQLIALYNATYSNVLKGYEVGSSVVFNKLTGETQVYTATVSAVLDEYKSLSTVEQEAYKANLEGVLGGARIEAEVFSAAARALIDEFNALAGDERDRWKVSVDAVLKQADQSIQVYQVGSEVGIRKFATLSQEFREDWKARWGLALDNYRTQWERVTASELARLDAEKLEMAKSLEPVKVSAEYDLRKTEIATRNGVAQLTDLTNIYAQLVTAFLSASDASLGTSASISLSGTA